MARLSVPLILKCSIKSHNFQELINKNFVEHSFRIRFHLKIRQLMSCLLCKETLNNNEREIATHYINCGTKTLLKLIEEKDSKNIETPKEKTKNKKRTSNDDDDDEGDSTMKTKKAKGNSAR